jgi:tetratricopeptide (TPR) repeat protein
MNGWMAYCDARFPTALADYADAIKQNKDKDDYELHAERARIFTLLGNVDSALAQMTIAVDQMRKQDTKKLVFVYESKAIYEQSIGMLQESQGNLDAAREAYGQALAEDLSYYPVHVRLGGLAFAKGDTATGLNEIDLAVQLKGDDPVLRYRYGYALVLAGKDSAAEQQMRKAIELEPYYAAPYQLLGRILDAHNRPAEAIEQYQQFLARAPRSDQQVQWTEQRIALLKSKTAPGSETPQ